MTSPESLNAWNRSDEYGSIQPPLTTAEVAALEQRDVTPETRISFGNYSDMARIALIQCSHIRVADNPNLTAETLAAFK